MEGGADTPVCALARLALPGRAGAAPGLIADAEGRPVAAPPAFLCCAGRGLRIDLEGNAAASCGLGARLKEVRRLNAHAARLTGDRGFLLREAERQAALGPALDRLAAIAGKRHTRGLAWIMPAPGAAAAGPARAGATAKAPPQPPPSLWTVALAAAWRFGLTSHVVIFGKTPPDEVLPPRDGAPDVIFIGHVDNLWDGHAADALDTLAAYAYGAVRPVFLELIERKEAPPALYSGSSTRSAFQRRIAKNRARSPLVYLPPSAVAKLLDVTDGLAGLARQAARERGDAPATAKVPALPWDAG